MTAGHNTVALAVGIDFGAFSQCRGSGGPNCGIVVFGAGLSPLISTPTGLVLTTNSPGGTSYVYEIAAYDDNGGISPLSNSASISGPASIDPNNCICLAWNLRLQQHRRLHAGDGEPVVLHDAVRNPSRCVASGRPENGVDSPVTRLFAVIRGSDGGIAVLPRQGAAYNRRRASTGEPVRQ
jgi:hypothetical protein